MEENKKTLEEAAELALIFHNTYEKLAPSFGYETRQDTKEFDFKSNNGRLMVTVCSEVIKLQKEQDNNKFTEEEVESICIEMVNWTIDNIGNPNAKSGEKFEQVIKHFKNK
jgi:hypothetical protein